MQVDDIVRIIATDPAAPLDIGVYVELSGHEIMEYLASFILRLTLFDKTSEISGINGDILHFQLTLLMFFI